jgi:hypothetical protein
MNIVAICILYTAIPILGVLAYAGADELLHQGDAPDGGVRAVLLTIRCLTVAGLIAAGWLSVG